MKRIEICIAGAHHFVTWEELLDLVGNEAYDLTMVYWTPGAEIP
jgi:hypothetical protein